MIITHKKLDLITTHVLKADWLVIDPVKCHDIDVLHLGKSCT